MREMSMGRWPQTDLATGWFSAQTILSRTQLLQSWDRLLVWKHLCFYPPVIQQNGTSTIYLRMIFHDFPTDSMYSMISHAPIGHPSAKALFLLRHAGEFQPPSPDKLKRNCTWSAANLLQLEYSVGPVVAKWFGTVRSYIKCRQRQIQSLGHDVCTETYSLEMSWGSSILRNTMKYMKRPIYSEPMIWTKSLPQSRFCKFGLPHVEWRSEKV